MVTEAYEVLMNEEIREIYDRVGYDGVEAYRRRVEKEAKGIDRL